MRKRASLILSLMFIFLLSFMAHAYSLKGHKISSTLTFIMHENFDSVTSMNFNYGLSKWNAQANKTIMLRSPTQRHTRTTYPNRNGISEVYRVNVGRNKYLAQASYLSRPNQILTECDINVNVYNKFANSSVPGTYDIYSILMHEAGHAAGLGHSGARNAVMYESYSTGELRRNLTNDDAMGINAIYK